MIEWKNTPDLYNDYCYFEECPKIMQDILRAYSWFFDDEFFYWLVKGDFIVKRRPLYWWPQKSTPTEKHKIREKSMKTDVSAAPSGTQYQWTESSFSPIGDMKGVCRQ